jgi:hypothetical protein
MYVPPKVPPNANGIDHDDMEAAVLRRNSILMALDVITSSSHNNSKVTGWRMARREDPYQSRFSQGY